MRVLVLDASGAGGLAAVVMDGAVVSERRFEAARGVPAALPALAEAALADAGTNATGLDLIGAVVGPGSFTGIRAALSVAHGVALGAAIPLVGVTVGEALAPEAVPGRTLWVASDSRRGRAFLERDGTAEAASLDALPRPAGPVAVAGALAVAVASRLAASGADVLVLAARQPGAAGIAGAAVRRYTGEVALLPAQPLYIDAPEARPSSAGQRPAPA